MNIDNCNKKFRHLKYLLPIEFNLTFKDNPNIKIVDYYNSIFTFTLLTIDDFQNENMKSFDPLVGENSCHLRSFITWYIFNDKDNINQSLNKLSNKINEITNKGTLNTLIKYDGGSSFDQVIKEIGIDIEITYQEYYLISSWVLTKSKIKNQQPLSRDESSHIELIKLVPLSKNYWVKFIKHLKKYLSQLTTMYVIDYSSKLSLNGNQIQNKLVDLLSINKWGLYSLPIFWATKVFVDQLLVYQIPIVLIYRVSAKDLNLKIVTNTIFQFICEKNINNESSYKLIDIQRGIQNVNQIKNTYSLLNSNFSIFIIADSVRNLNEINEQSNEIYINRILHYGIIEILTICMAIHKQYAESNINQDKIDSFQDIEYFKKLKKANSLGCNFLNPYFFCVNHIFCDKTHNVINYLH